MITVVVCGQKPEKMARLVSAVLSRYGAVRISLRHLLAETGSGDAKYSVVATERLERLTLPRSILLLADQNVPRSLELSEDTIVVTGADNRRMTRLMKDRVNPVVVCGTGVRDTVTLSSASGDRVILCAQRKIPTVSGAWTEPLEFAVTINGCDMRSALLAAGTAAVCGCDMSAGTINIDSGQLRV